MAYGIGFILGPVLGGALGAMEFECAGLFAAGMISLTSTVLIYFMLPELLPKERRVTGRMSLNDFNPFASVVQMASKPGLGMILLIIALFNFSFDGINSMTGVFIKDKLCCFALNPRPALCFVGIATVEELREACIDFDVRLIGCQMTMDVFGFKREDFIPQAEIGGAATFLEYAADADIQLFI